MTKHTTGFCAALRHNGAGVLLGIALSGCAWFGPRPVEAQTKPKTPPPVEMLNGGLLVSQAGKAELGLMLINNSARTLWIRVYFRTPGGLTDCVLAKELESRAKHWYVCPQPAIRATIDYPVQITVFTDIAQTQVLDRLNTRFRFEDDDVQAIKGGTKP